MKCSLWIPFMLLLTDLIDTWLLAVLMTCSGLLSAQRFVMSTKWSRTSTHCHYQLIRTHTLYWQQWIILPFAKNYIWIKCRCNSQVLECSNRQVWFCLDMLNVCISSPHSNCLNVLIQAWTKTNMSKYPSINKPFTKYFWLFFY